MEQRGVTFAVLSTQHTAAVFEQPGLAWYSIEKRKGDTERGLEEDTSSRQAEPSTKVNTAMKFRGLGV